MFKMLIVLFAVVGLSSCGTVAGIGDDIKSVAKWSEEKMTETKEPKEVNDLPLDTNIVTQEEI